MAVFRSLSLASAAFLAVQSTAAEGIAFLAPEQDIVLPSSNSATNPLEWLGANSPFFAGPNVNGVSNEVPDGCEVEQVAYAVRHGSRYPDNGAYIEWTTLYAKIQAAEFTATGDMAFLHNWQPVLTKSKAQIAQESPTGFKEAFDLGYQLRTRYPSLYAYGTPFISWSNLYPRVVQTAQDFVRGFLGSTASTLGMVVTVNSTGSEEALFDSLSPSDLCPNFVDGNGGDEETSWSAIYLPPITARLNTMMSGNLTFTTDDVSLFPYLCGFESQITGALSPWCSTFTDAELAQYEYAQDLRYYYGVGPGVDLPSKIMLPFINSFVGLLKQGPGVNGTFANGTKFTLPNILTAFMNDGQITELGAATGVWDNTTVLSGTEIPAGYAYLASRFVNMRGTVAFERLNCAAPSSLKTKRGDEHRENPIVTVNKTKSICPTTIRTTEWTTSAFLSTKTYKITSCAPTITNCPGGKVTETVLTVTTICPVTATGTGPGSWGLGKTSGFTTLPSSSSSVSSSASAGSSVTATASSEALAIGSSITSLSSSTFTNSASFVTSTTALSRTITSSSHFTNSSAIATSTPSSPSTTSASGNQTYIRILLNDAVYPVPSCQDGPGKSCLMSQYVTFLAQKLEDAGDLKSKCNVTGNGAPDVLRGASFFTELGESWLATVTP